MPFGDLLLWEGNFLRILAFSDGGCHTGFATVAHEFYTRWAAAGHEIHVNAVNYRGDPFPAPYHLYPAARNNPYDVYGQSRALELLENLRPDALFFLNDLPVIFQYFFQPEMKEKLLPWLKKTVLYIPVDCVHLPPPWFDPVRLAHRTVAQTRWGSEVIRRESGLDTDWAWHGVNHAAFHPASRENPLVVRPTKGGEFPVTSKRVAKDTLRMKDKFLVVAVNRNTMRKNLVDTLKVFAEFARGKKDAALYLHTIPVDQGIDLPAVVARLGLADKVGFPANLDSFMGVDQANLSVIYNAADVFFSTSCGEGFGLTMAEALACGVPVVAQDFSAISEVVGEGGILTPVERLWTTGRGADLAYPRLEAMAEALEKLHSSKGLRRDLSEKALQQAAKFTWDEPAGRILAHLEEAARIQ